MSELGTIDALEPDRPYEGIERRALHSDGASVYWYRFEPGASFPQHRHVQEQMTIVQEGTITLRTPEGVQKLDAGSWVVTPPWEEHGITAQDGGARFTIILTPRRAEGEGVEVLA